VSLLQNARLTADYINALALADVNVKNWVRRQTVTTYAEFLDVLYDDLKLIVERLEENPQNFLEESEDATTQRLIDIAFGFGYTAQHVQKGGNVDVTISIARQNFHWIGEAKKFDDVGDLREGYLQLSTRYRAAMDVDGLMHGGLIGYLRRPNAKECMEAWENHFSELTVAAGNVRTPCPRRGPLAFVSEHAHQDFGTLLRVWHLCVQLHFSPKDRSGRTAQRYAT
jgi:hypothetical protein